MVTSLWSAGFALYKLQVIVPPGSRHLAQAAMYAWPAALVLWVLSGRRSSPSIRWAAGWCAAVVLAFVLTPKLLASPKDAIAIPVLALALGVAARWPALMVLIAVAVSSAFGDLEVYWHFPTQKVIDGVLIALLLSVATVGLTRRRLAVVPRPLVLVLAAYLFITAVMVPLADDRSIAVHDFATSGLYFLIALVIAHAGWAGSTYRRMAGIALAAGLLVGAYATLRIVIGPSHTEFVGNQNPFDYVSGNYRAIGSFHAPQDLGFWASTILPFTFAFAVGGRRWWRLGGVLATLLLAISIYGSGVRVALVAGAAGLLAALILYQFARGFPGLRLGITLGALLLGVGTGAVLFSVVHSTTPAHGYTALLHPGRDPSVIARKAKWAEAFRELRGHPFGYGMGSAFYLSTVSGHPATNVGSEAIDNGYLYVALEQGLAVMGLFIAGLLALLYELGRGALAAQERFSATLGIGAAGLLVSLLISSIAVVPGQGPRLLTPCIILGLGLAPFTNRATRSEVASFVPVAGQRVRRPHSEV